MEKDLKDKKQEEKNTPKIPWTKLVPAAAVIAALVFSGIKAKGSDGETEAVGQAETTVMSASELEKYLGYEKENTVSDSTTATAEKNSTTKKKSSSKKSAKKTAAKKSSGIRTVSESAKSNAGAAGQGTTQRKLLSYSEKSGHSQLRLPPGNDFLRRRATILRRRAGNRQGRRNRKQRGADSYHWKPGTGFLLLQA